MMSIKTSAGSAPSQSARSRGTLRRDELRLAADVLQRGGHKAGFRRRRSHDAAPDQDTTVRRAVARAKEGDSEALRYLYIRYSDNVYGFVRSIVRDDNEAADVTQHVFAKLMTSLSRYEERSTPFVAWIMRLAHNAAIDHLRVRQPIPSDDLPDDDSGSDEGAADRSESVRVALDALPDEQRNVVVLRHVVGLSPSEIAHRMGRTESSVHGLHHRGRIALQVELTRLGCVPNTLDAVR